MGHSSKKKKRGGGGSGKRSKGRTPLKDHGAHHQSADDNELLSEEITALYVEISLFEFLSIFYSEE